jgi:hypothetical protein
LVALDTVKPDVFVACACAATFVEMRCFMVAPLVAVAKLAPTSEPVDVTAAGASPGTAIT